MAFTATGKRTAGLGTAACLCALMSASSGFVGVAEASGPNSDFPDSNLVMPFVNEGSRLSFLSISNLGSSGPGATPVPILWEFYGESGELLARVERYMFGEGGTDVVDAAAPTARRADWTLGPAIDLSGRNGFAVVSRPDGSPDLIGNWTAANLSANSSFGANAAGLGFVGQLASESFLFGTSFRPTDLEDNLLVLLALDDRALVPTSLTGGEAPPPGEVQFSVNIALFFSDPELPEENLLAEIDLPVRGSASFVNLEELFPGFDLDYSVTIGVTPLEADVGVLGFYGQALGQFGAGQSLRTDLPFE